MWTANLATSSKTSSRSWWKSKGVPLLRFVNHVFKSDFLETTAVNIFCLWNFYFSRDYELEGSAIVYCPSKKETQKVSNALFKLGIRCGVYHAGLSINQRRKTQYQFMRDEIQVGVCFRNVTVSFLCHHETSTFTQACNKVTSNHPSPNPPHIYMSNVDLQFNLQTKQHLNWDFLSSMKNGVKQQIQAITRNYHQKSSTPVVSVHSWYTVLTLSTSQSSDYTVLFPFLVNKYYNLL